MRTERRRTRLLADRLLAAQRDELRRKEQAARNLSNALCDLRDAADRLRAATVTLSDIDGTGRGELRALLGLTATETNIAFDAKHAYVLANNDDYAGEVSEDEADPDPIPVCAETASAGWNGMPMAA